MHDTKMMRQRKLNGWQRLWIVISVIYLISVIAASTFYIVGERPTNAKIKNHYIERLLDLVNDTDSDYKELSYGAKQEVFDRILNDNKLLHKLENNYKDNNNFIDIKEKYDNDLKVLNRNQVAFYIKSIVMSLLIWMIPMCLIYAFGLSVSWIRKGFKSD